MTERENPRVRNGNDVGSLRALRLFSSPAWRERGPLLRRGDRSAQRNGEERRLIHDGWRSERERLVLERTGSMTTLRRAVRVRVPVVDAVQQRRDEQTEGQEHQPQPRSVSPVPPRHVGFLPLH